MLEVIRADRDLLLVCGVRNVLVALRVFIQDRSQAVAQFLRFGCRQERVTPSIGLSESLSRMCISALNHGVGERDESAFARLSVQRSSFMAHDPQEKCSRFLAMSRPWRDVLKTFGWPS
jgi:hypothetical protein